jgi:hypothetical protein
MLPDNSVAKMASSIVLTEQDKGRSISITPPVQKLMEKRFVRSHLRIQDQEIFFPVGFI